MKSRGLIVLLVVLVWFGGIGARHYELQIQDHQAYRELARQQQQRRVTLEPPRGTIFDSQGRKLALSLEVDSAWACPRQVADPARTAGKLAHVLEADEGKLVRTLTKDRSFVWVARQLDAPESEAVRELGLDGVGFLRENKRYYPMRDLASQVLGFASVDHKGLEGLEGFYDKVVTGEPVKRRVLRDARAGTVLSPALSFHDALPGKDLHLTIDAAIQHVVERELAQAVAKNRARSGTALVLDPNTGAVRAMASLPSFDPNRFGDFQPGHRRNRAVTDAFEPGSTFKLVTAAAALEANLLDPSDVFDCEMGGISFNGVRINDHKSFGLLTFREVIAKSSNVGAIKIGLLVGRTQLADQIRRFGFGSPTGIDLPGESPGIVHPVERWPRLAPAYISFGQGISVTALQLANAFAAVANGGQLLQPYVVQAVGNGTPIDLHPQPTILSRPISPSTARALERLLEAVVSEGTGHRAAIDGYRVAGKTGTAQKAEPGRGYSASKHVASFVGFVPARDPEIVVAVVIDEPQGAFHGGAVAAPVFSAIARDVLLYLRVPPDREPPTRWPGELVADFDGGEQGSLAGTERLASASFGESDSRGDIWLAPGTRP